MINFALGAICCGTILIIFYFALFSKRKIINYKKKEQLERLISQNDFEYLLIDIRSKDEFTKSHIPSAVNIPFNELMTSLPVENMFLTIIVYGGSKRISCRAADFLSESGYFNVTSFGSLSRWKGNMIRNEYLGETYFENTRKGRENFPV